MGTIDRLNAGHAAPIYVVQIEGYDRLLTTAADPAAVLSAWQASSLPGCADVTAASAGLAVDWDQEQEASPWEPFGQPPMIRLSIVTGPDATGAITDQVGIDLHKRSGGIESQLVGTMRPITNQIAVRYSDAFDASGVAHVGPEAIAYDTNDTTTDELQDVTRGLFSPFHAETGARFARSHRGVALLPMTSDPLAIQLPPLVSSERRIWIGRWVAVWITDAPSGSYEQPGDHRVGQRARRSGMDHDHGSRVRHPRELGRPPDDHPARRDGGASDDRERRSVAPLHHPDR